MTFNSLPVALKSLVCSLSVVVAVLAIGLNTTPVAAAVISVSCGPDTKHRIACIESARRWEKSTRHSVRILPPPYKADDWLGSLQRNLRTQNAPDLVLIDASHVQVLSEHLQNLSGHLDDDSQSHFEVNIRNNTNARGLFAMPWSANAGVLYYRADLLKAYDLRPPLTWSEMVSQVKKIRLGEQEKGNDVLWGLVFSGKRGETLTAMALEWFSSYDAGTIVDAYGVVTVDNNNAMKAMSTLSGMIGDIAPRGVLDYTPEQAGAVFQNGRAIFWHDWTERWPFFDIPDGEHINTLQQGERGEVSYFAPTHIPLGSGNGTTRSTLGGLQVAVATRSKVPEVAIELLRHMSSLGEQKLRALRYNLSPTIESLYSDDELIRSFPGLSKYSDIFRDAVPRPTVTTGLKYPQVTKQFSSAVHKIISGRRTAHFELKHLKRSLIELRSSGW